MKYRKRNHRLLAFLLALAMICSNGAVTFPVNASVQEIPDVTEPSEVQEIPDITEPSEVQEIPDVTEPSEVQEIPDVTELSDVQEIPDVTEPSEVQEIPDVTEPSDVQEISDAPAAPQMSPYTSGQGTGVDGQNVMELVMLDPSPSGIQTAGMVTAQEAGITETIASASENVYYNVITEGMNPSQGLKFQILAGGQGLNNYLQEESLTDRITLYDSEQNMIFKDVKGELGGSYELPEGITINGKHKKAIDLTYPSNLFQQNSTYYLVVSDELQNSNGNAVLGTKVVFKFTTKEFSEPDVTVYNVSFNGSGAADAEGEKTVISGNSYKFTLNKEAGYDYTVQVSMGGGTAGNLTPSVETETTATYTVAEVTGNLEVTIEKNKNQDRSYKEGQGGTMQIYMLDPSPSSIQTDRLITAGAAGITETIASASENVYYNVISEKLDPSKELAFRILAVGQGLSKHFPEICLENKLTIYDSEQKIVNTDVTCAFGEYSDTELSGVTIADKQKKAMLFTYPKSIFKGNSTYYLVVSDELKTDNGNAVLGTKVVFRFETKEASEPAVTYYNVKVSGNGAADVEGDKTVSAGNAYTFTVTGNPDYIDYTVTASVSGAEAALEKNEAGNVYTIKDVNGDVDIHVTKRIKSAEESPLKYGGYKAGQGSRSIQIYALDPVSANIQTAGRVPAETAGLGKIAREFEEVYYNQILSEFDPGQAIAFKILAAGAGVGNGLRSEAICEVASVYDSNMNKVSVNASHPGTFPQQESCDAEFTVENNEARHKKSTSVIYPANTFESGSTYYLVIDESLHVNTGGILGNKVVFSFKTKAAQEPEKQIYNVVFGGNGAADASGAASAEEGSAYTFVLAKKAGYNYTVKATMSGNAVTDLTSTEANGTVTYRVAKVTGNLVITITSVKKRVPAPQVGTALTDSRSRAKYKVTKTGKNVNGSITGAEAAYTRPLSSAASVTVPDTVTIKGIRYKITSIGNQAFKNNKVVTRVKMGNNIKTIGKNAFSGCKKLRSVTIGKNVTAINEKAFYKCSSLNGITIPAKVAKIGKQAFYGCKNLKKITIKTKKLTTGNVGNRAFGGIYKKVVIKVPKKKAAAYRKLLKKKGTPKKTTIK